LGVHESIAGDHRLADLIDVPLLKSMMDDFYELTNIPMSLLDLDSTVVVGAGWQDACTRFHRVNPETCANCMASDTILAADIPAGETKLYKCKNGMWDAATPIMVRDRRVGTIFTGQFFFDDEIVDLEFFREQARRYGFDQQEYLAAIQSVPRLSRSEVEVGLRFLTKMSTLISKLSFSNMEKAHAEIELQAALSAQTALAEDLAAEWGVLQAMMENTDTHLAYLDPDFNFVAVNSTYVLGSGYTAAELIGRSHFELFPNAENEAIFERARKTGEPVSYDAKPFEFPNQPWRGVTYWDWRLTPVKGRTGRLQGFAFSLRDVTRVVSQRAFSDAINRLSDVVHSNLDFDWILEQIVPELAAATGCEFVAAALRSPDGQWRFQEVFGLPDDVKNETYEDERLPELAEAVRSERPVLFEEADGERQATALSLDLGVRSMLVAPLPVPGQQGAIVYGYRSGPGVFDESVVDFSAKIASSLSLALSNSLRFHDAMRAARLSGALAKVDEILLSALTPEDVVARLVDEASKAAGAKRSLVIEVRDRTYTITHVRGVSEELVGTARDASYYPAFALAASQRQPVLIEDNWNDPRTNKEFVVPNELRAFQLLPLTAEGKVTHVLALVYDEPRSFHDDDRRSAERMAAAMSLALTNARLYERERRIADRLQGALLALPEEIAGVEFAHAYHAASDAARVGGDFYDIFELDQDCVGVTVGDVAGKGLDAAVLTSLVKNTVRAHAHEKGKTPVRYSRSRTMSSTRPPLRRRS
jgi:PAS domain S-box-containing protein